MRVTHLKGFFTAAASADFQAQACRGKGSSVLARSLADSCGKIWVKPDQSGLLKSVLSFSCPELVVNSNVVDP